MELTGMAEHERVAMIAEEAMRLWRAGDGAAATQVGELFWSEVPEQPVTDGDHLSQQLSLMIAGRAAPVDQVAARRWLLRARAAYGEDSVGGVAMCDFVEGRIAFEESQPQRAREFFERAVSILGPRTFAGEDPKYKAFFYGVTPTPAPELSVADLAEQGEELCDAGNYAQAVVVWRQALAVADPDDEETLLWLHASIGDAQFQAGEFRPAYDSQQQALLCGGTGNPFVWLRSGQAAFELGDLDAAAEALLSAYLLEGDEIFEDEDPKYRHLLVERSLIS